MTTSPGPHSGDDTFDLIDDALATLAERRGAWIGDDLTAITLIASLIDQAERCLPELVTNARLNGHTWDEIARALATSPDQARLRYGPDSPVADSRWPYDWLTRPPSQLHNRATRTPLHANLYPTLHFGSYADSRLCGQHLGDLGELSEQSRQRHLGHGLVEPVQRAQHRPRPGEVTNAGNTYAASTCIYGARLRVTKPANDSRRSLTLRSKKNRYRRAPLPAWVATSCLSRVVLPVPGRPTMSRLPPPAAICLSRTLASPAEEISISPDRSPTVSVLRLKFAT